MVHSGGAEWGLLGSEEERDTAALVVLRRVWLDEADQISPLISPRCRTYHVTSFHMIL